MIASFSSAIPFTAAQRPRYAAFSSVARRDLGTQNRWRTPLRTRSSKPLASAAMPAPSHSPDTDSHATGGCQVVNTARGRRENVADLVKQHHKTRVTSPSPSRPSMRTPLARAACEPVEVLRVRESRLVAPPPSSLTTQRCSGWLCCIRAAAMDITLPGSGAATDSTMKFAGSVMLGDLNDFIAPAQACVNPLFAGDSAATKDKGAAKISLDSGIFSGLECVHRLAVLPSSGCLTTRYSCRPATEDHGLLRPTKRKTAKITLSDCLACR